MAYFYFNAYVLIPAFLNKRKASQYALYTIISFAAVVVAIYYLRALAFGVHMTLRFPINSFFTALTVLALSSTYRFLIDRTEAEKKIRERENENLKTELSFLRSQISPHFMFNVLNNIVALSRSQKHLVEGALIRLSNLMRYMLYESDEKKVLLENEVDYLKNYIELQQMRFGNDVQINFNSEGENGQYYIEPMLLIPFVENAFKHGIGIIQNPEINIDLIVQNNHLDFKVSNNYNDEENNSKDSNSGIGLTNVSRRLNLLYPNRHDLKITKDNHLYEVHLSIELK
jgi:sensor histidine kinase YesM